MAKTVRHEGQHNELPSALSADADAWNRKFVQRLEQHLLKSERGLSSPPEVSDLQIMAAHAFLATLIETGVEAEAALEIIGQAIVSSQSAVGAWTEELNDRRFALIDKEIQGGLTQAEIIELAGLTGMMRQHVDTDANLPVAGARALHRRLLQMKSTSQSE